jgi:hypothetical protein
VPWVLGVVARVATAVPLDMATVYRLDGIVGAGESPRPVSWGYSCRFPRCQPPQNEQR